MEFSFCEQRLSWLSAGLAVMTMCLFAAPAGAVVVAGGDNGWEVSFDGNVNGFWVYEDSDPRPSARISTRFNYISPIPTSGSLGAGQLAGSQGLGPRLLSGGSGGGGIGSIIGGVINAGEQVLGAVVEGGISLISGVLSFLDAPVSAPLALTHPMYCAGPHADPNNAAHDPCHINATLNSSLQGGTVGDNTRVSRVRTGLLPAFFSFNVRSPEVAGLRGSARISFAPQIQNANTKNQFGSQVDLREVFFNVDGDFGTLSVGRTLSLFQRQNILNDMTLFGVGVNGGNGADGGGTTLGRIGYGYVYPQFNARIAYKTPNINGFQLEVGIYDPSKICHAAGLCAATTKLPRLETELSYALSYDYLSLLGWFGAMWQEAEDFDPANASEVNGEITAWGVSGGLRVSYQGFSLTAAGYNGEALGSVLMLDTDSLDRYGNERENYGFYVQGSYAMGALTLGVSYGENNSDRGSNERHARHIGTTDYGAQIRGIFNAAGADCENTPAEVDSAGTVTTPAVTNVQGENISTPCSDALLALSEAQRTISVSVPVPIETLSALTFGAYYDVTSWFKLVAEYTRVTNDWHDWAGANKFEVDSNVFSVGSFFTW